MDTLVRVRLIKDTETLKVALEVSVRSNVKAHLWTHAHIDADEPNLCQKADAWAQKAATSQCQRYGDMHDPRECGRLAAEAMRDILKAAELASNRPGVGASKIDQGFGEEARKSNV